MLKVEKSEKFIRKPDTESIDVELWRESDVWYYDCIYLINSERLIFETKYYWCSKGITSHIIFLNHHQICFSYYMYN